VPGLPGYRSVFLGAHGSVPPTAGQCAGAWNTSAPQRTLAWLGGRSPDGLRISVAASNGGALCMLRFNLGNGRTAVAQGPWTRRGVPRWQGMLQTLPDSFVRSFLDNLNGAVGRDGRISCAYLCNASPGMTTSPTQRADQPTALSGARMDACALLTPTQVKSVLGHKPRHRTSESGAGGAACRWHDGPLRSLAKPYLFLQLVKMGKTTFKEAASTSSSRPLTGLGELAYVNRDGHVIAVWRDGIALTVATNVARTSAQTVESIARAALARL
jgi:hypothetical protein